MTATKITLSPTEEFFRTNDEILVRAWTGTSTAQLVSVNHWSGYETSPMRTD